MILDLTVHVDTAYIVYAQVIIDLLFPQSLTWDLTQNRLKTFIYTVRESHYKKVMFYFWSYSTHQSSE